MLCWNTEHSLRRTLEILLTGCQTQKPQRGSQFSAHTWQQLQERCQSTLVESLWPETNTKELLWESDGMSSVKQSRLSPTHTAAKGIIETYHVLISLQCDFEDITLLRLSQEKEHGLGLVCSRADKDHASLRVIQVILLKRTHIRHLKTKDSQTA